MIKIESESYRIPIEQMDTRSRIIESALLEFARVGYNGTSTARIAARASISEAMVFKMFKSKKELLHEVLLEIVTKRIPIIANDGLEVFTEKSLEGIGLNGIKTLVKSKIQLILKNTALFKVLILELNYHEDIRAIYVKEFVPSMIARFSMVFEILKSKGEIRKDLDTRVAVRSIMGMMAVMILDYQLISEDMNIEEEVDKVLDLIIRGLR